MEIQPFAEKHIEEAAELFQHDFNELIDRFPYLHKVYADRDLIAGKLKDIAKGNPGVVALQSGSLVGFMIGYVNIAELKGSQHGTYVPEWANSSRNEDKKTIYERMYKAISKIWVADKISHI